MRAGEQQYLTFAIGEEEFAVPVLRVREIVAFGPVTRVPSAPPWIRGVVNLRGGVVPVVDLGTKFGLPAVPPGRRTCIVVVEVELAGEQTAMGVIADAVLEVAVLRAADIEPPPPFGSKIRIEFLVGLCRSERGFLQLLDIDKVLSTDELLAATSLEAPSEGEAEAAAGSATEAAAADGEDIFPADGEEGHERRPE
jgi:purine-binding chemotaxis protein CheW